MYRPSRDEKYAVAVCLLLAVSSMGYYGVTERRALMERTKSLVGRIIPPRERRRWVTCPKCGGKMNVPEAKAVEIELNGECPRCMMESDGDHDQGAQ